MWFRNKEISPLVPTGIHACQGNKLMRFEVLRDLEPLQKEISFTAQEHQKNIFDNGFINDAFLHQNLLHYKYCIA